MCLKILKGKCVWSKSAFPNLWFLISAILLLVGTSLQAQGFKFESEPTISFIKEDTLYNPQAGGINAGQYNSIDLDNDGIDDIVVFDRTTHKLTAFLTKPYKDTYRYHHAPQYEKLFPQDLQSWVLLIDYNHDGKKDIFTYSSLGVRVFKNSTSTNKPEWVTVKSHLETQGTSSIINLLVNAIDIPSITDIDEDGDVDILAFDGPGDLIEYHQNQQMEKSLHPDSLVFKRVNSCWGKFQQGSSCGEYIFEGVDCGSTTGKTYSPLRVQHTGSTLLITDLDGDGDKDLLNGHVGCLSLAMLTNEPENNQAKFIAADDEFPIDKPIRFPYFPATFYEDVDFDGIKDLIAAPNVEVNEYNFIDFRKSSWLYKNTGTNHAPEFTFQQDDFLQSTMVEVGENAFPALEDYDGDGDLDLFIGSRGYYDTSTGSFYATIHLYDNIGTNQKAVFRLKTEDYLNLSSIGIAAIKPFFTDINGDGLTDIAFTSSEKNFVNTDVKYILNTASKGQPFQFLITSLNSLPLPIERNDTPLLYDLDGDTDLDALVGKSFGNLEYYINTGSNTSPVYTLKSSGIGTSPVEPFESNLTLSIADWDGNGQVDLLTGDERGKIIMYPDIISKLQLPQIILDIAPIDWVEFGENSNLTQFKGLIFPTAADINKDNLPDLIVGTQAGGLAILKNSSTPLPNGIEELTQFGKIYPNPVNNYLNLQLVHDSEVVIFSMMGQSALIRQKIQANKETSLDLTNLPAGVYFLKISTKKASAIKKFVVYN